MKKLLFLSVVFITLENIVLCCDIQTVSKLVRSRDEMQTKIGIKDREYFRKEVLNPLVEKGKLALAIPDKPNSPKQKYQPVIGNT